MTFRADLERISLAPFLGLDTRDSPLALATGMSPDCLNVDTYGGKVATVDGVAKLYATAAVSAAGHGAWVYRTPTTTYLLTHCGTEIDAYNGTTHSKISGATACGTVNSEGATYNGISYFTNTTLGYYKWDATTFAAATGPAGEKYKYVATRRNRVFLWGEATSLSRLRGSVLDLPESWDTAAGAFMKDVGKGDGDQAMGIFDTSGMLLLFKRRSLWYLSGTDEADFYHDILANTPGTVSHRSITDVDGLVYWLSDYGVMRWTGDKAELVSDPIGPTVATLQASQYSIACAAGYDHEYHLWVSTAGSTNNKKLILDTRTGQWTMEDSPHHPVAAVVYPVASKETLVTLTGDATGFSYKEMTGADHAGAAIDAYWTTPIVRFGRNVRLHFAEFFLDATGTATDVEIQFRIDGKTDWSEVLPITTLQPDAGQVQRILPIDVTCSAVQLRVRNRQLGESFTLHDIILHYEPKGGILWRI